MVQDIHINDLPLKEQLVELFNAGDYQGALNILSNSQLSDRKMTADVYNTIAQVISTLENNYYNNVEDYLSTLLIGYLRLIDEVKNTGDYEATKEYKKYNFVYYNNLVYMYISDSPSSGKLPTNTTYWKNIGLRGENGASGLGIAVKYQWQSSVSYSALDLVYYQGASWVALSNSTGQVPAIGSSYWQKFVDSKEATLEFYTTAPQYPYLGQMWFELK